jgi:hypothetical protein
MFDRWLAIPRPVPGDTTPTGRRGALLVAALLCSVTLACAEHDPTGPAASSTAEQAQAPTGAKGGPGDRVLPPGGVATPVGSAPAPAGPGTAPPVLPPPSTDSSATPAGPGATPPGRGGRAEPKPKMMSAPNDGLRLATCNRQSARTVSRTIGAEGGILTVNGHQLDIPPGALSEEVTITMSAPVDTVRTVDLLPEGLRFNPGARPTLYLNYAGCHGEAAGIAYVSDALELLEYMESVVDGTNGWISTRLAHFSRYAVHY